MNGYQLDKVDFNRNMNLFQGPITKCDWTLNFFRTRTLLLHQLKNYFCTLKQKTTLLMGLLFFYFLISIVFSFLCSIWEAVILSITPAFAQIQLEKGTKVGKLIKTFKENIDRPLAAILTLNTIAHTVGAIMVGNQAAKIWESGTGVDLPLYFTEIRIPSETIIAVVMTIAILLLSEIVPKTLGANYWEKLAGFTVKSLNIVIKFLDIFGLVKLSQFITKKLKKDKQKSVFSKADFTAMTAIGEKEGVIQEGESKIIQNLLRFDTIRAKDIMTPRTVVIAAKEEMSIQDFYNENKNLRFSRIPIYKDSKDHISGFILKDVLLTALIHEEGDKPLKDIMREILIVNEQTNVPDLFNNLMETREHIALVVDEFGGMSGIVSMEDVIETLLGMEIMDEFDNTADMQQLARKNWEKRAKNLGLLKDNPAS